MSKRGERAVRFAAGSLSGRRSSIFRVWAIDGDKNPNGSSDIYFAERSQGELIKTSLHSSGKWRTAFTDSAVQKGLVVVPPGADRKMTSWPRPPAFGPGLTPAYRVVCPSSELRIRGTPRPALRGPVEWVQDPGAGYAIEFLVAIAAAPTGRMVVSDPGPHENRLLDTWRLPNGEKVGVLSRIMEMNEAFAGQIRAAIAGVRFPPRAQAGAKLQALLYVEFPNGVEGLVELAIPPTV